MVQKFYDDTLTSKFIKHLLATENVPLCNVINNGDTIFMHNLYVYQTFLIYCVKSGVFIVPRDSMLSPGPSVYSNVLVDPVSGGIAAEYKVIRHYCYNEYIPKVTSTYNSNISYYDTQTHFHLGRYLRYRSALTGVNLMPFYNCYCGQTTDDLHLVKELVTIDGQIHTRVYIQPEHSSSYKVFCVPIRFNKTYTVAIDCSSEVFIGYRIHNSNIGDIYYQGKDLSTYLESQNFSKYTTDFKNPFLVKCKLIPSDLPNDISGTLYLMENSLQMLIQVPSDNTSSVVVLEGNYTPKPATTHNLLDPSLISNIIGTASSDNLQERINGIGTMETNVNYSINPFLLSVNARTSYAFTGRLIEHLLLNSINSSEELSENIIKVQELLRRKDPIYDYHTSSRDLPSGVWSEYMETAMTRQLANIQHQYYMNDVNGEFNVDIEKYYQNIRRVNLSDD